MSEVFKPIQHLNLWFSITVVPHFFSRSLYLPLCNVFISLLVIDYTVLLLPLHCRTFPIRGFQIYDGPVQLTQSTFRGFIPTPERYTSAVGFNLKNTWQLTPRNNLSQLSFSSTVSSASLFI